MIEEEILGKEYYIVDCYDFVYFPRIAHIVGVGSSSADSELEYYINTTNSNNEERIVNKNELERFKTFEEAKEYAEYLNNIPKNKERAEKWNTRDKEVNDNDFSIIPPEVLKDDNYYETLDCGARE